MSFEFEILEMRKIWNNLEQQLAVFEQIVPFERNPHNVYSPNLINIMLSAGPQIESMARTIANELNIDVTKGGIPYLIRTINEKGVLSKFLISSTINGLMFTPFVDELLWWNTYTNTKHDMLKSMFEIRYQQVMDCMAALFGLHKLADVMLRFPDRYSEILDSTNWNTPMQPIYDKNGNLEEERELETQETWKSKTFKTTTYFFMDVSIVDGASFSGY